LILEPKDKGHEALLFIHPRSPRDNDEFYRNSKYGEFWIGRRMTLDETETKYGIKVALLDSLESFLAVNVDSTVIRGEDSQIDALVKSGEHDDTFLNLTSVMRMTKDEYEIKEMQKAIDATSRGFADMVKVFPVATSHRRGERIIEAAFFGRARVEGNDLGYDSIVASGSHACVLHWIKNDGEVKIRGSSSH